MQNRNEENRIHVLDFRRKNITRDNVSKVIDSLEKLDKNASQIKIDLGINALDDEGIKILAQGLKESYRSIQHLHIDLNHNRIVGKDGIEALASVVGPSSHFYLDLGSNPISMEAVKFLAERLTHDNAPQELGIGLACNLLGPEVAILFADALKTGLCKPNLYLNLRYNQIGSEGVNAIAQALESGFSPSGLQLDLGFHNVDLEGFKRLMQALGSATEYCPPNLLLDFSIGDLGDEALKALAAALETGCCPPGLRIILASNNVTDIGVEALGQALSSGFCPKGLEIGLGSNNITDQGIAYLADAFKSGNCPQRLALDLCASSGLPQEEHPIVDALLSCTEVTRFALSSLFKEVFSPEQQKKLDFYCFRNQMIEKYPQLEFFIKKACFKLDMYQPGNKMLTFPSLKCLSGSTLFFNKDVPIPEDAIPFELQEFLMQLGDMQTQLQDFASLRN